MSSIEPDHLITEYYESDVSRAVVVRDEQADTIPFDRLVCEDMKFIGQAWLDLPRSSGEALPEWSSFNPVNFKAVLPKFCVIKVGDWRANQLEFSLVGSHVVEFIGGGRPLVLQEIRKDPKRSNNFYDIKKRVGRAIDQSAPQYVRKTLSWNGQDFIEYEALMLPFRDQNGVQRVAVPLSAWIDPERLKLGEVNPKLFLRKTSGFS